ncbi:unnamed protein product, partial [Rotaria sp. Silwood2]
SNPDNIGYTVMKTTGLSDFNMSLSPEDIDKQIDKNYSYSKAIESCVFDLESKVKSIDIKQHYDNLQKVFDIKSYYPENIHFPLDVQTLPEGSLVREVFSQGYGKTFVSDLEDSYGQQLSVIETKDIEDDKILGKLTSNSTVVGYLQTPRNEIHLETGYDINRIADVLLKYYLEYEKTNAELLEEIRRNISLITNASESANIFVFHRIMREKPVPIKKEILCLLKDIDKIEDWNPFIMNHKDKFYEKIECYLVQEVLIQQIKRVTLMISKYKSLDSINDKDERDRILENIFTNILMERSYDKKVYPSWLLVETENNLLIRSTQYSLIKTMMEEKDNSIYQLNMGEGKTSVILIILSEMLANGEQIARINCLESLMGVMQEL